MEFRGWHRVLAPFPTLALSASFCPMRVLLRNSATGLYFVAPAEWTCDRSYAEDLRLIELAVRLNNEQRLGATHIVLAYDSPACNLTLPITNYSEVTLPPTAVLSNESCPTAASKL